MPEIIPLGWFHLFVAIAALISGIFTLVTFCEIKSETGSGKLYLIATLVTAVTALMIYQRGEFGPGHALAVLTLLALVVGFIAEKFNPIGKWSRHLQALSYSATLLFHCVPAVTDGLLRLPVGSPILTEIDAPLMRISHLGLVVLFLIGVAFQLRWIHRQQASLVH